MVTRSDWQGLISGRSDPESAIRVEIPLAQSRAGGSGAFLALGSDNQRWWIKTANNSQGERIIVTEFVVGAVGNLIGAPTCKSAVIRVGAEVAGWEFRPGLNLEEGLAHGSLAVDGALESRALDFGKRDDNVRRHTGIHAVYDWCWGADPQWLYSEVEDKKTYSHDHGWYLPEEGPNWTEETLMARVDEPRTLPVVSKGLDAAAAENYAARLESIHRAELVKTLKGVPLSWAVTDSELEALGYFLEKRAPQVADRIRKVGGATS